MVRRCAAHGPRCGVRDQAGPEPGRAGLVRGDLLRPRGRAGPLLAADDRCRPDRGPCARRPDRGVPPGVAGPVFHERHEPARRRSPAASRDRGVRARLDRHGAAGGERVVRGGAGADVVVSSSSGARTRVRGTSNGWYTSSPTSRDRWRPTSAMRSISSPCATRRGWRTSSPGKRPTRAGSGRVVRLPLVRPPQPGDGERRAPPGPRPRGRSDGPPDGDPVNMIVATGGSSPQRYRVTRPTSRCASTRIGRGSISPGRGRAARPRGHENDGRSFGPSCVVARGARNRRVAARVDLRRSDRCARRAAFAPI